MESGRQGGVEKDGKREAGEESEREGRRRGEVMHKGWVSE